MLGLFQRPKLDVSFVVSKAVSNEFMREVELTGRLALKNEGSDADVSGVEMMIIAGFRRIPLAIPEGWAMFRLARGQSRTEDVRWKLTLDAPLRAQAGELFVGVRDQKRKAWQWRLPFRFELH
ncbi:MAG: hypothetical protein OZ922_05920 [Myxococcales bacterium]|jgi:hypothetical protein|nr:hypothetical protein [Myxococcales bacterium]